MNRWLALFLAIVVTGAFAQVPDVAGRSQYNLNYEEPAAWQEVQEVDPPAFPKKEDLREFYVSAVTTNKYFLDGSTLLVGTDNVVRYVLVVQTSGGATNVSFEGIHCKELTWKHYASGRSDGTWTKSRAASISWRPIENKPVNRHHAALSRDLLCPGGMAIRSADEGRNALRQGKHPNAN
jgi:hypothetical protein